MRANPSSSVAVADLGTFDDVLVKARDGWRFKKRVFFAEPGPAAATHRAQIGRDPSERAQRQAERVQSPASFADEFEDDEAI